MFDLFSDSKMSIALLHLNRQLLSRALTRAGPLAIT